MKARWLVAAFVALAAGLGAIGWRLECLGRKIDGQQPPYESLASEIEELRGRLTALERKGVRAERAEKKKK